MRSIAGFVTLICLFVCACKPRRHSGSVKDIQLIGDERKAKTFVVWSEETQKTFTGTKQPSLILHFDECELIQEIEISSDCEITERQELDEKQSMKVMASAYAANSGNQDYVDTILRKILRAGVIWRNQSYFIHKSFLKSEPFDRLLADIGKMLDGKESKPPLTKYMIKLKEPNMIKLKEPRTSFLVDLTECTGEPSLEGCEGETTPNEVKTTPNEVKTTREDNRTLENFYLNILQDGIVVSRQQSEARVYSLNKPFHEKLIKTLVNMHEAKERELQHLKYMP